MQALFCEVLRALMKLGTAIAANRPITVTTIMISTRVKPLLRDLLMFILPLSLLRRERNNRWISISSIQFRFTYNLLQPLLYPKHARCQADAANRSAPVPGAALPLSRPALKRSNAPTLRILLRPGRAHSDLGRPNKKGLGFSPSLLEEELI